MTSADAQAFKRACACFGLGRYFYDFAAPWIDLDQHRQPVKTPAAQAWAIPENWRRGMRPPQNNGNGNTSATRSSGHNGNGNSAAYPAPALTGSPSAKPANSASNGNGHARKPHGNGRDGNGGNHGGSNGDSDVDRLILRMETVVGTGLYRNILREHGRVNQPRLIRDAAVKQKVLRVLELASIGWKQ